MFRRPELLVAASVPVLLLAGVLSWHRDVLCTQAGCGTVAASAWTGSPVWAAVLVVALALAGAWVLLLPTRGQVPLAVAALTGVAGVVSAAIVVVSLDALVFNHAGFFGFDLPVTETFPVLAVHPGPGVLLGLARAAAAGGRRLDLRPPPHRAADPTPSPPGPATGPARTARAAVVRAAGAAVVRAAVVRAAVVRAAVRAAVVRAAVRAAAVRAAVVRAAGPALAARDPALDPARDPAPAARGPQSPEPAVGGGRRSGRGRRRRGGTVGEPDA